MKRILFVILALAGFAGAQNYNFNIGGLQYASGASVPGSCNRNGSWFYKNSATIGWYVCQSGVYVAVGSSGGVVSGVSSVFGRSGAVTAANGDYSSFYVNKAPTADQTISGAHALTLSDVGSSFLEKGVSGFGSLAVPGSSSPDIGLSLTSTIDVEDIVTEPGSVVQTTALFGIEYDPSGAFGSAAKAGLQSFSYTKPSNSQSGNGTLQGGYFETDHEGSGHITNTSGGHLSALEGNVYNIGSGILDVGYGIAMGFANLGGGTFTNGFSFYGYDLGGSAVANPYYSWFDSRGVRRVKEDNTFNSVGQAIDALYNPQFTKYTPGAADYERIILGQWSSNIAQIGTEKGGTGTLRELQLLGTDVLMPSGGIKLPGSSSGTATIVAPAAAGTPTLTLPTTNGTFALALSGTSASLGGGALLAGACASNATTITGATTTMVALADPNTYPGDGTYWDAQVTSASTVTVKVCAAVALTPTASTYNIRVVQ